MQTRWIQGVLGVVLVCGVSAARSQGTPAAAPAAPAAAGAPAGSTAQCKDGSYSAAKQKWQACGGHKGVQTWFADAGKPAASAMTGGATAGSGVATNGSKGTTGAPPAQGGGPGMVWVNLDTKVYHCPGAKFYGKTKNGTYLSEADAKAAGDRPDRGKACGA